MPVSNATYIFAKNLFQYGFTLILPAISLIGFVLNCICFIVFSNRNLKEKIHFYLMIKSFIQTILQAIFVFMIHVMTVLHLKHSVQWFLVCG